MEIADHIEALRSEGELLAVAAERAGLDAAVPSCPPWTVRDLLKHIGYVHRWAAAHVTEQRTERLTDERSESEVLSAGPSDPELLGWYQDGHASLVHALETADPALQCWTVVPGPSALASWARRQAHETAIHRLDAELAGGQVTPFHPGFAADGIDELVVGLFGRDAAALTPAQRSQPPRVLQILAKGAPGGPGGGAWLAELTADGSLAARVSRGTGPAECTLTGPASEVYPLLWNRQVPENGVTVTGDPGILRLWRESMQVRWR